MPVWLWKTVDEIQSQNKFRSPFATCVCSLSWQRGVCGLSDWLWLYSTALALISFIYLGWPPRINVQRNYRAKETTEWLVHIHTHSLTHSGKALVKKVVNLEATGALSPLPPSISPRSNTQEKKDTCCDARCLIFYATLYRLAERGSLIKACALICLLLWCSAVFVSEGARGHIGTLASLTLE